MSKVIVIERTYDGQVFEWEGEIIYDCAAYIETKHRRNAITHPQWHGYHKAYSETYTKHYLHPDNVLSNLKFITK